MGSYQPSAISYQLSALKSIYAEFPRPEGLAKGPCDDIGGYGATVPFPSEERFGLISQMRRAAASIPANIAEGCVRSTDLDFARFLHTAMGSASEVKYFILLARDLGYLNPSSYEALTADIGEIKRMLSALIARLKADG